MYQQSTLYTLYILNEVYIFTFNNSCYFQFSQEHLKQSMSIVRNSNISHLNNLNCSPFMKCQWIKDLEGVFLLSLIIKYFWSRKIKKGGGAGGDLLKHVDKS